MGRNKLPPGKAKGRRFQVRCTDFEGEHYDEAAEELRKQLGLTRQQFGTGTWMRRVLNQHLGIESEVIE